MGTRDEFWLNNLKPSKKKIKNDIMMSKCDFIFDWLSFAVYGAIWSASILVGTLYPVKT